MSATVIAAPISKDGTSCHTNEATETWTVNDLLRHFGPDYLSKYQHSMSLDQIKTMQALMRCRTGSLGYMAYRCTQCASLHHVPKSCGNRHCPSCQGDKAHRWLADQQQRLLPCAYFMVTFTVPDEFRRFIRSHPRECYQALFAAASKALMKLARDPKYIGSDQLGMTAVLHTWGRDLNYHPHLHFIVPGGALSRSGFHWLSSRADFLVPVLALSKLYRAKYKAIMKRLGLLDQIDPAVWQAGWNVDCQAVGDGRASLRYLAPYVFRVAIGNHRIGKVECHADGTGSVEVMVKPTDEQRYKKVPFTAEEFIRRFLQHVLPRGLQKVRHFGFMHKRCKIPWHHLEMLVTITLNMVYVIIVTPPQLPRTNRKPTCIKCGGELECLGFVKWIESPLVELDSS